MLQSARRHSAVVLSHYYRGADKSLARPGTKQARKNVRDARDFNNIETRAVKLFSLSLPPSLPPPLQGQTPEEIHAILTETLACFLPRRAKDLINIPVMAGRKYIQ